MVRQITERHFTKYNSPVLNSSEVGCLIAFLSLSNFIPPVHKPSAFSRNVSRVHNGHIALSQRARTDKDINPFSSQYFLNQLTPVSYVVLILHKRGAAARYHHSSAIGELVLATYTFMGPMCVGAEPMTCSSYAPYPADPDIEVL